MGNSATSCRSLLQYMLTQIPRLPQERKDVEDKLYGKNGAGTEQPAAPIKSPLAQGHIQDEANDNISAPAELTGMTGQYIVGRDVSPISEQ